MLSKIQRRLASEDIIVSKPLIVVEFHAPNIMLEMLSHHFSTMDEDQFKKLPTSTNSVESHNRLSKVQCTKTRNSPSSNADNVQYAQYAPLKR